MIKIECLCSIVMVFKIVFLYDVLKKYVCVFLGYVKRYGFVFYWVIGIELSVK